MPSLPEISKHIVSTIYMSVTMIQGRRCDGYGAIPDSQLMEVMFDNVGEKRAYQFFYEKTAPELSDYFEETFWNSFVMRAGRAYPAVKHSVLAIGAAYEAVLQKKDLLQKTSLDSPETLYLQEANKAIHHLVSRSEKTSLTAVLLCSILFYHLGFLMPGNGALHHLNQGLRIIREYRARGSYSELPPGEIELVENLLIPLITRLAESLGSVLDPAHCVSQSFATQSIQETFDDDSTKPVVPEAFSNLHQAKESLMSILKWVLGRLYQSVRTSSYRPGQQYDQIILSTFQKWSLKNDAFIQRLKPASITPALAQVRCPLPNSLFLTDDWLGRMPSQNSWALRIAGWKMHQCGQ